MSGEAETLRQIRIVIRTAMNGLSVEHAAARAECHPNTLWRILRGENCEIETVARIVERLGGRLDIRLVRVPTQGTTSCEI
jgi:predicted transcriptional regulator